MSPALRVGVVGAGIMGTDHVNTLHRYVSGARVTVVADIAFERAQVLASALPGARATTDAFGLIEDPDVDAVVIASPDPTHADLVLAAVNAMKPVMCEKPLAPTSADCLRVVRAELEAIAANRPSLVSLGFMRRFDPAYQDLKAALDRGACGAPMLLHCVSRGVRSAADASSELTITGSAVHEFDVVPWLLDAPVTEVSWHAPRSACPMAGLQDPQVVLLRTADGVLTTLEVFLNAGYGYDIRCEIVGDKGTLALANPVRTVIDSGCSRSVVYPRDWRPRFADAYRLELQAWVDAVSAGRTPPLATARDGLLASAVAEAVILSMQEGGRIVAVDVGL